MEVILREDVQSLGKAGEVIKVKPGFARNYLLPQNKAYAATSVNIKRIEKEKEKKHVVAEKVKQEAQALAQKLAGVSCTVNVEVNDIDKLYGSVTDVDIVKALEAEGYTIDKKAVIMPKPIEELGIYEVPVKLHPEVVANVRVWVTKK